MTKNYTPIPNFYLRPKHICQPHSAQTLQISFICVFIRCLSSVVASKLQIKDGYFVYFVAFLENMNYIQCSDLLRHEWVYKEQSLKFLAV